MMKCWGCDEEVFPFQAAHWTCPGCKTTIAICFQEGPSSSDPAWLQGEHLGVPAYVQLAQFRKVHAC